MRKTVLTRAVLGGGAVLLTAGVCWLALVVTTPTVSADAPEMSTASGTPTDVQVVDDTTIVATVPAVPNFQPATVALEVLAGSQKVPTPAPLEYTYSTETAIDRQMQYLLAHWNN